MTAPGAGAPGGPDVGGTLPSATARPARGAIHDLGYERYVGTRRPPSTRWRVICRHQVAMGWKTWWRYKAALGMAVIISCVGGGLMYLATNEVVRAIGGRGHLALTFADGVLPLSIIWYCRAAFLISLTIGATTIAGDVQSGAFTFYFARSTRPADYLIGKLAGYGLLVATIAAAGPLALALLRLGLSDSTSMLVAHLTVVPKALAVGAIATLAYAAVPLGFSAMIANRRYAMALWAGYYLIGGAIATALGVITHGGWVRAIYLANAVEAAGYDLFGVHALRGFHHDIPLGVALASIGVQAGAAIAITWYRVRRAQRAGVGGAT